MILHRLRERLLSLISMNVVISLSLMLWRTAASLV